MPEQELVLTEQERIAHMSTCPSYGSGFNAECADCIDCNKEFPDEYKKCKISSQNCGLSKEEELKTVTTPTTVLAVSINPFSDCTVDSAVYMHPKNSNKSIFSHGFGTSGGTIDKGLLIGKSAQEIVDNWNDNVNIKPITLKRVYAHIRHLLAEHDVTISCNGSDTEIFVSNGNYLIKRNPIA